MPRRGSVDASDAGRLKRLQALDDLMPLLTSVLDVRDVFVRVSEVARRALPHDFMGLPLVDDDGRHVTLHGITGVVMPDVAPRILIPDPDILVRPWDFVIVRDTLEDELEKRHAPARAGIDRCCGFRSACPTDFSACWISTRARRTSTMKRMCRSAYGSTDTTVLLTGQSGTGKEVIARIIHRASARDS